MQAVFNTLILAFLVENIFLFCKGQILHFLDGRKHRTACFRYVYVLTILSSFRHVSGTEMSSHVPSYLSQEVSDDVRFRYVSANGF